MAGAVGVDPAPLAYPRLFVDTAPSKQITFGFVGVGNEGYGHNLKAFLVETDARALAVCDVMAKHRTRAQETVDQSTATGCQEMSTSAR